jgi:prepilin-type processing-associated H-X9-DG protein
MTKSKIVRVRWGLLRPGATVISESENNHEHKVVTVEHQGSTVNVLFWDGVREHHGEDAYARVRLSESTRPGKANHMEADDSVV